MYKGNNPEKSEDKFAKLFDNSQKNTFSEDSISISGQTKEQFNARVYNSAATTVFISIYLGIVFLISSSAVLSLQHPILVKFTFTYDIVLPLLA